MLALQKLGMFLKANRKPIIDLLLILVLSGLTIGYFKQFKVDQIIENLEMSIYDLRYSLLSNYQKEKPNPNIVQVVFDDETLAEFEHAYGAWPWSRKIHADLIKYLYQAGTRLTIFDIMFAGKGRDDKDDELIKAYLETPNTYLGFNLTYIVPENLKGRLSPLPGVTVDPYESVIRQFPQSDFLFLNNNSLNFQGYRPLLKGLMQNPHRLGCINHMRDVDGVSRGNPLVYKLRLVDKQGKVVTRFIPYLGLKLVLHLKGFNPDKDVLTLTRDSHLVWKDFGIPLRQDGMALVNWLSNHPRPYTEIPVRYLLESIHRTQAGKETSQDHQLKKFFKNKFVFIGSTAVSTFDIKTTPVQRIYPGVTFQAMLFDNLLNGQNFVHRVNNLTLILITGLLCLLGCFMLIRIRAAVISFLAALVLAVCYIVITQLYFTNLHIWIDIAFPLVCYLGTVIITFAVKYMSRELDYNKTYKLATTDSLTGLYNHRYFMEQAQQLIARCKDNKSRFSVVLVDIDHFKKFNDTYGHLIGDAVLRTVAQTLKQHVRSIDVVARYGGEEMAILLARTSLEEAMQVAHKLVTTIGSVKHNLGSGISSHVTISAGVATYPQHGGAIVDLIEHADKGLYLAKDGGRNQVGLAAPNSEMPKKKEKPGEGHSQTQPKPQQKSV